MSWCIWNSHSIYGRLSLNIPQGVYGVSMESFNDYTWLTVTGRPSSFSNTVYCNEGTLHLSMASVSLVTLHCWSLIITITSLLLLATFRLEPWKKMYNKMASGENCTKFTSLNLISLWEWMWCHRILNMSSRTKMRAPLSVRGKILARLQKDAVECWWTCRAALWRHVHSQSGVKYIVGFVLYIMVRFTLIILLVFCKEVNPMRIVSRFFKKKTLPWIDPIGDTVRKLHPFSKKIGVKLWQMPRLFNH